MNFCGNGEMRKIMDFTFALMCAIAIVTAVCAAVFVVHETFVLWHVTQAKQTLRAVAPTLIIPADEGNPARFAKGMCEPDGVAITTFDRLRMLITSLDVMVAKGKYTMLQVSGLADQFARNQPAPDVTLAQIQRCEPWLQETHGYGYGVLTSALVREAAARRNESSHSSYVRAATR